MARRKGELTEVDGPEMPTADGTGPSEPTEPAMIPAGTPTRITEPDDEGETLTLGAEVETPEEGEPQDEPKKSTRKRKRNERYDSMERRMQEAERRAADAEARMNQLQGFVQAQQHPPAPPEPQTKPDEDPLESELDAIYFQRLQISEQVAERTKAGQLPASERDELIKKDRALERKYFRKLAESTRAPEPPPSDGQEAYRAAVRAQVDVHFPDVVSNPQAHQYAQAMYQAKTATGRPGDMATLFEAMNEARAHFSGNGYQQPGGYPQYPQNQPPPPPPQMRPPPQGYLPPGAQARTTGAPRGAGAGGGGGPPQFQMTKDHKKMADLMYPTLPPAQRYQEYTNKVAMEYLRRTGQVGSGT